MEVDKTQPFDDSSGPINADPLGIIGWEIGGKYKIRGYIGGGGFGEVYDAYNLNLVEQRLVIKFFKRVQERARFDREARILCMLDHPNISRVIDFLPDEGALVVQYIDGRDGSTILREVGALDADLFINVARSVTDAISYAHDKKIAHRDIKPANVLIDRNRHVYLIDFGIAKEVGGDRTKTGYQALTPMFAAPERQTGESSYNPFLSDVYEMGITLFNFATNSMPYRNPVSPSLEEWGGIHSRRLSPQLRYILKKATHPDPTQRYQTAGEMASDLRDLKEVFVEPKKKISRVLLAALVVVVVAAGVYLGRGLVGSWLGSAESTEAQGPADSMAVVLDESQAQPLEQPEEAATSTEEASVPATDQAETQPTEQAQTQPEQPVTPPVEQAPTRPELTIRIEPDGVRSLYVDGRRRTPGNTFETAIGSHTVEIVHPEYPVLRKTLRVTEESARITYELKREFVGRDTLSIQVALLPPSEQNLLEINLNGRQRRYTEFPVLDLICLAGTWNVDAELVGINVEGEAVPKIDSMVTFPYGGGPRSILKSAQGTLEFSGGESGNIVPLLIYWSQ
ncbi:MAG: protein kinase [Candidatus Zixiibacteriota bacterium]|nr:MAG: protein kinase [candidate division Zixibacteria bacterium]